AQRFSAIHYPKNYLFRAKRNVGGVQAVSFEKHQLVAKF
ncbi:unnamed protein product, partial [Rotaria sp. Silwood1]